MGGDLAGEVLNLENGQLPFDVFADTLRGTYGIVMDMYRQPEKIIEAMEYMLPMTIESVIKGAEFSDCPIIMMPLHKGDDTFMSDKQYERFYWPTFRKVIIGLLEEGLVPYLFAEGSYNNRLEIIKDLPRASVVWTMEKTDMSKAKKILGDSACIAGNVLASQLYTQTPQAIKEYCRKLIETCAPGGGYILSLGSGVDKCDPASLRAIIDAAKEYGVYN